MPIVWRVKDQAQRKAITNISQLAASVGVAYDTAADLWHGRARRIDLITLERVCVALACIPADLLVLIRENASEPSADNQ